MARGRRSRAGADGAVLGIDVGGTKVAAAVVDGVHVRGRIERATEKASEAALLDLIVAIARDVADAAGMEPRAAGVGVPSQVDAASGTALASVNIPLAGVPLRTELGNRLGVPVSVDNDANCAALGEAQLVPDPPADELVMLTLGTGVGGGIVIDGQIFRGATGIGAELGHMVVDGRAIDDVPAGTTVDGRGTSDAPVADMGIAGGATDDAPAGTFPRPGSLEWHCSGRGLEREATRCAREHPDSMLGRLYAEQGRVSGRDAVAAAREGDRHATSVLERYGRWLGIGVATVVNVFEPQRIVIGGGISRAAELFLDVARAEAGRWALPALWERTRVELARGGPDAGVIGAAVLAVHELEHSGHTAR
jgi:glucokinase